MPSKGSLIFMHNFVFFVLKKSSPNLKTLGFAKSGSASVAVRYVNPLFQHSQ